MAESRSSAVSGGLGSTLRRDTWWLENIPVIVLLGGFGIYATLRAFEGKFYEGGPYLSPFYSPLIDAAHHWWPFSPALLILAWPLGFRVTCYYYRKAYYRAFFLDPPACAVGEPGTAIIAARLSFPFILQNIHRYFLYARSSSSCFLWYDAIRAFFFVGPDQAGTSALAWEHWFCWSTSCCLLLYLVLLPLAAASDWRQARLLLVRTSFGPKRHGAWRWLSFLNERHMLFAWMQSDFGGFADFYVRMVASGMIKDLRIL